MDTVHEPGCANGQVGRRRRAGLARVAALALAAVALAACSNWFPGERPEGRVSAADVEYPNINEAPDRPSDLLTPEQRAEKEQEMQQVGAEHVTTTQQTIETVNRRQ